MSQSPDKILENIKKQERRKGQGRLKIYLGMVAGVGKTYAMLKQAHQLKKQGSDIVVGYIETHGRQETQEQIGSLEVLSRKTFMHKDIRLEEFDLDLALERKPDVILVDEFAHSNVPGSRHPKRYQDILELLGHGIDVHTTLNVQHVQSRSDTVAKVTGITIHELIPDSLIDRADDIVFIDQDPDEIIYRLNQGKIYQKEKAEAAAKNFFKPGNLTALREIGLRLMAERVDHELTELKSLEGEAPHARPHHHLMVTIFFSPYSEYLVRWTRRHAYALNCSWSALYVRTSRPLSEEEESLLRKNFNIVKELGGEILEIQDNDIVQGILRGIKQQQATQLVLGKPHKKDWKNFFRPPLTDSLIYNKYPIDIHIVSPLESKSVLTKVPKRPKFDIRPPSVKEFLNSALVVGGSTVLNLVLVDYIAYHALGLIYTLSFSLASLFFSQFSVVTAACFSALLWNFVFIPPRFTFAISQGEDYLMLLLYLVTAVVVGLFTRRLRRSEKKLRYQGERTESLYHMTQNLAGARDSSEAIYKGLEQIEKELNLKGTVWTFRATEQDEIIKQGSYFPSDKDQAALQWAYLNRREAGKFTDTLPAAHGFFIPLIDPSGIWGILGIDVHHLNELTTESHAFIKAIAQQLAFSIGRDDLSKKLQIQQVKTESEKIFKSLLNSVSHELMTPITAITGFSDTLLSAGISENSIHEMGREINENAKRLNQVVKNFLDMGRLESGQLKLQKAETDLSDLLKSTWFKIKNQAGQKIINFHFPTTSVIAEVDAVLISQAFENIIKNALRYTSDKAKIDIQLVKEAVQAKIIISDNGPGLGSQPERVFDKFWRAQPEKTGGTGLGLSISKAFIELHEGQITAENLRPHGAQFKIYIPLKGSHE
jgi:two-component system, OmpR family, sensor histidine kinase KdpD